MNFEGQQPALFFSGAVTGGSVSLLEVPDTNTWLFDQLLFNMVILEGTEGETPVGGATLTVAEVTVFSWTYQGDSNFFLPSYEPLINIVAPPGSQVTIEGFSGGGAVDFEATVSIYGRTIPRPCYFGTIIPS